MTRSWLGLFVLVVGYGAAAAALIAGAFYLHILLGIAAFCLIAAGVTRALNRLFAEDKEAAEVYSAPEGGVGR